jgi:hypothetical protein
MIRTLRPRLIAGGALTAAAAVAAVAAALTFQPASAQTATPSPTPGSVQRTATPSAAQATRTAQATAFLDRVAAKLGVTADRWRAAFLDTAKEDIRARVAEGKLTQAQADRLIARLEQSGPGLFGLLGRAGAHGRIRDRVQDRVGALQPIRRTIDLVASTTGLTARQVQEQLRAGQTLAEIGASKGKTQAQLRDAIVAETRQGVETAVTNGRLTRQQADRLLQNLPERIDRLLTSKFQGARRGR